MGGGSWSDVDYDRSVRGRAAFDYSDKTLSKPARERQIHQLLNPEGLVVRESRDSAEHHESNAIMVGLDVTGSMGRVAVAIQSALGNLMDMLLNNNYLSDPQLLFYAIGDATCDQFPFQISQFESDNRINEQLSKVLLEGGGGGQKTESYEIGFYAASRLTSCDCYEKRGKKGYLFSIGDEMPYGMVNRNELMSIFGSAPQEDLSCEEALNEAKEKFNCFHIIPKGSSHFNDSVVLSTWDRLFEGKVFKLDKPEATAELIAVVIGLSEGTTSLEEALAAVADKRGQELAEAVRRAIEPFAKTTRAKKKPTAAPKEQSGETWKL